LGIQPYVRVNSKTRRQSNTNCLISHYVQLFEDEAQEDKHEIIS